MTMRSFLDPLDPGVRSGVELPVLVRTDAADGKSLPMVPRLGVLAERLSSSALTNRIEEGEAAVHLPLHVLVRFEQIHCRPEAGPVAEGPEVPPDRSESVGDRRPNEQGYPTVQDCPSERKGSGICRARWLKLSEASISCRGVPWRDQPGLHVSSTL